MFPEYLKELVEALKARLAEARKNKDLKLITETGYSFTGASTRTSAATSRGTSFSRSCNGKLQIPRSGIRKGGSISGRGRKTK